MTARTSFRLAFCCMAAAVALSFVPPAGQAAGATSAGFSRPALSPLSATAVSAVVKFRSAAAQDTALQAYTSPKSYTPAATGPSAVSTTRRAAAIKTASRPSSSTRTRASAGEIGQARSILASLIAKYPILKGSTVEFGDARGYQAITYYASGRIILSETHTASLSVIVTHEAWHIIDWRDNGRIDWGENVPR